jgi:coenzyme PQQ precursor peptide PqqA
MILEVCWYASLHFFYRWVIVSAPNSLGFKIIKGGIKMAWKTPKVLEISIGMEINCYACAEI